MKVKAKSNIKIKTKTKTKLKITYFLFSPSWLRGVIAGQYFLLWPRSTIAFWFVEFTSIAAVPELVNSLLLSLGVSLCLYFDMWSRKKLHRSTSIETIISIFNICIMFTYLMI